MVFKCQEDSFLKEFTTKVIACEPATLQWCETNLTQSRNQCELQGFNVICEDTILFPEGGGQPCDYGTINEAPVRSVIRKGEQAIHFVETVQHFDVGAIVKQRLNWERRFDHMQQHSGQHLLTELIDKSFGYETVSWWLGSEVSFIELDTNHLMSQESLDLIENQANDIIRYGKDVEVILLNPDQIERENVRAPRGLPKDVQGPIRVIRVDGQRDNMCCGTHVSNLIQLQIIKLLYVEKSRKGMKIFFLIGQRVLKQLNNSYRREQQINLILKCGPQHHIELIMKLQNELKITTKLYQKLLKDIALIEAENLSCSQKPLPLYYSLHRKDGLEPDFINIFLRHAPEDISLYFLTVWDVKQSKGHMVLKGKPKLVNEFAPKFLELLDGKGSGQNGIFQAKISNQNKLVDCEALLKVYTQNENSFVE